VGFTEGEKPDRQGRVWRQYADPYRPYQRKSYRSGDPLAEKIRRHHNTSIALQLASRLRNALLEILFLSGDPLDGLEYDVPVELVTLPEILKKHGIEQPAEAEKSTLNPGLAALNQQREEEAEQKYQENLRWALDWATEQKQLPTLNELRHLLAEDDQDLASSQMAQRVLDGLLSHTEQTNEKGPFLEEAWSIFEGPESLGPEGEEGDPEKIGSPEPHTALINNINGDVWFTPDLSLGDPSIAFERQGEEGSSDLTKAPFEGSIFGGVKAHEDPVPSPSHVGGTPTPAPTHVPRRNRWPIIEKKPRRKVAFGSSGSLPSLLKRGRGWVRRISEAIRAVVAWWLCWRAARLWLMVCNQARGRSRRNGVGSVPDRLVVGSDVDHVWDEEVMDANRTRAGGSVGKGRDR